MSSGMAKGTMEKGNCARRCTACMARCVMWERVLCCETISIKKGHHRHSYACAYVRTFTTRSRKLVLELARRERRALDGPETEKAMPGGSGSLNDGIWGLIGHVEGGSAGIVRCRGGGHCIDPCLS